MSSAQYEELLTQHPYIADSLEETFLDPIWRLENLYYVLDEMGRKVPFRLRPVQRDFLQKRHCLNLILKGRQLGFTTFIQIEMLDSCLFNKHLHAGVIAHNQDDAKRFFRNKIKFAYDNIPEKYKPHIPKLIKDSESELTLSNGSNLHVGTSMRSGTLQRLHISEYGKLCRQFPDRANEVKTGALNAVHVGQRIDIESTAEGREGDFFDLVQAARSRQRKGDTLTDMDFKFFFYPWWIEAGYSLDSVPILTPADVIYFDALEAEYNIRLTDGQKAWYIKKRDIMGDDMKREFPSTPDEAFESSIIGSYLAGQLNRLEEQGHICNVPYQPQLPVDTYWDIGRGDYTAIWFIQAMPGGGYHVIDYFQSNGEDLREYAKVLAEKDYLYRDHIGPHDLNVTEMMERTGKTRKQLMADVGIEFTIAPKVSKDDGVQACRTILSLCWFDRTKCDMGLKMLRGWRKKWNDALGCFSDQEVHDEASHGAHAFKYFALCPQGYRTGPGLYPETERRGTWMSR